MCSSTYLQITAGVKGVSIHFLKKVQRNGILFVSLSSYIALRGLSDLQSKSKPRAYGRRINYGVLMKITKYPQSCLKIENEGRALLVDVGTLATAEYSVSDFGHFDAVLFTHRHIDHLDPDAIKPLAETGATIYGNADVAQFLADRYKIEVIDDGEELVVADFRLKAFHMEHCLMVDGSKAGVQNTGFLIDGSLLLPGDSVEDIGIIAEIVALPVFGPNISLHDAFDLAKATKATKLIPVHYDVAQMNPELFVHLGGKSLDADIVIIENGESTEV